MKRIIALAILIFLAVISLLTFFDDFPDYSSYCQISKGYLNPFTSRYGEGLCLMPIPETGTSKSTFHYVISDITILYALSLGFIGLRHLLRRKKTKK